MSHSKPVNVVTIQKDPTRRRVSSYVLHTEALRRLLEPIKDKELAIISVVGDARRGKSFLLNYMAKFLADKDNWLSNRDAKLKGFHWQSDDDPQTMGFWLSQPFPVKKSDGSEIYVLLMDTQGLFDRFSNSRDWSTIVGFSLLVSSCVIFNVFNSLDEKIFETFDTFIKYGLEAMHTKNDQTAPFQKLVFLIRDWNIATKFKFGSTGGMQYLDKQLTETENMSPESVAVRQNIKKCFESISCFLMPTIGDGKDSEDFDGRVSQLREDFVYKMRDFITILLNSEEMSPKMIDKTPVTGEEMFHYFRSCVDVFNNSEGPDVQRIIEMTAKIEANIYLRKLKDLHLAELRSFCLTKPFVTNAELRECNEESKTKIINMFESSSVASDQRLKDNLYEYVKKNLKLISDENDSQRMKFMENKIEECVQMFQKVMEKLLANGLPIDSKTLEELFKVNRKNVFDEFKSSFGGEEDMLFNNDLFELTKFINNYESATRIENLRRIDEFKNTLAKYVDEINDFYSKKMVERSEQCVYLNKEQFRILEAECRSDTEKFYQEKLKNLPIDENFYLRVDKKLKESKNRFKNDNQIKCENVVKSTENAFQNGINEYKKRMIETIDIINSVNDLDKHHQNLIRRVTQDLNNNCVFKAPYFISSYEEKFREDIRKLYEDFVEALKLRIDGIHQRYRSGLEEAKSLYDQQMKETIETRSDLTSASLTRISRTLVKNALDLFDNNFDPTSRNFDPLYKSYRGDLKDALGEQFDEFVEQLEKDQMSGEKVIKDKMRESLDTLTVQLNESIPLVNNEDDFVAKCVELRDRSVQEFRGSAYLSSISDQSLLNSSIKEFETKVDERVKECRTNQEQRKSQIEQANRNKVAHAKDAYMKQMSELLRIEDLVSDEEFREFTDELKRDVLSTLSQQLESLYTDDTQNFYDEVNQFIDQEFDRFFVVNEAKRNNRLKMIKELAEKYIEEYREQMNESLDSIKSEEQLLREHNHLLECLLEKARQSDDLKSKKLIGHQLSHIETEISILFTNNLTIFRENIGIFDKTCKELFEQSKDQYIAKMDSHFKDDKFYSDKEMNDFQNNVKTDTITHFLDEVSTKGLKSQTLVDQYVQQLNEFFEQTFVQYIQKNEDNRSWFETKLREKSEELVFRYELDMNSNSESMLCLEDLNAQHNRLMEALLKIFNEHIQKSYKFIEFSLLDKYQWDLQTALSNKLPALADKLRQRLNRIIEGYRTQSCILEETYVLKVEELVKDDELLSDESLEELHKRVSNEVIVSFEDHLRTNPCSETQSHFIQFKDSLDALFADIAKRYKTDRNLKLKNLEFMVNDFINMYEKAMKDQLKNIENLDQLAETHEKVKEQVIQIFREMSQLKDAEQLKTFTDKILDNIDNSLIDFRDILELHIENQQTLAMNLRLEIRRYYKEEMHRYMANKLFVPTVVLDKCHHKVVRNTKDHYKEQRRDINDKNFVQLVEDSVEDIYKKIKEENEMKKPTTDQAIGIDFGTTNSCVAYFRADSRNPFSVFVIPNELGHNTTPSVFSQRPDGTEVVGFYAKDEIHFNSRNTIISPKRLIGRTFDDQNVQNDRNLWPYDVVNDGDNKPKISIMVDGQEQTYYPEQVAAKVLKKMKDIATNHLGCEVTKAVITVPAYFNDSQKEATKQAGQLAGLEVLKIINEPTAAAFAFKVDRDEAETRNVLIYDFGGGTFDVAILEIKKGEINVKAVGGDNHLGGDDVDTNLINHCLKEFRNQFKVEVGGPEAVAAMSRLRRLCEENKKRLTSVESTTISIPNFFQLNDLNVFITRDQFEAINEQLFARTIDLTNSTLTDAGLSHSNINDVVLVGGSTRIPRVQQMLSRLFGDRPLNHSVNPDEAVAVGAAIRAALLNGQQSQGLGELVIRDVTPLSLGIRIKGGSMSTLIPRNTTVPVKHTRQYYTSEDNQTVVTIAIFEGEKKMANDNHQLGEFELSGIPLGPRGEQPIDVTFDINDEGILHVKAKIVNTGGEEEIEITEHKGRLTDEQLERLMNQNS